MKTYDNSQRTGIDWSKFLQIEVTNPKGWDSVEDYERVPIDRQEFLLRASQSVIIPPKNKTRRAMQEFRQNLMKKYEKTI